MDSLLESMKTQPYFFDDGIRFECQRCGACCTGEPGVVYVNDREITEISDFMDISRQVFIERCLYRLKTSYAIREADDGRCIFFENGCAVYPVRPLQCRTFPFWFQNMRSLYAWKGVAVVCPGIGKGHLYSKEAILECIGASYPIYEILVKEVLGR
ncbi:Flagellin N-methylase [anaerobic digester metagenome]|jgi:Fe-S-cluster containining protein|uniref:Flagellin N-methylase n=1 Tax=anaerobic digester metagenome TaxID=1263854 RepID=A0A485M6F9_9ZZZZ